MRNKSIPSPCIGICSYDPDTIECLGCKRTPAEITGWSSMTAEQKRKVKERIELKSS